MYIHILNSFQKKVKKTNLNQKHFVNFVILIFQVQSWEKPGVNACLIWKWRNN